MSEADLSTGAILESISDGVFTVDTEWRITSFNRAAEQITGIPREQAIGCRCSDVFRASTCQENCALQETLHTGRPVIGRSAFVINADGSRLPVSVSTAVLRDRDGRIVGGAETFRDLSELEALREQLEARFRAGDLYSRSPQMQRIFEVLPAVAESPSTVLISGHTGAGKEVLARTIHALSPRSQGPFVAVNCAALPDTLLESELFGYKAGAFTDARKDKPGRFAQANGGTLLLDEIGEVSPALQVRLLRVLQDHTYEPLGSTQSETSDVRILAATNQDLADLIRRGRFREDLYYRINIVHLTLPPLKDRKEDIPLLVDHFVERFNSLQHKSVGGVSAEALALLMAYDWPGNVRELENVIERSFVLCRQGTIEISHLPEELTARHRPSAEPHHDLRQTRRLLDAATIRAALKRNHYNRLATANDLGIHKSTLFRRIKKLGISLPTQDGRSNRRH
ncbi:PAS domain S-box protein [candidate division GN15 bacterium]|nr:PAS domain S-box protein [candidate division GN15 bacterium]